MTHECYTPSDFSEEKGEPSQLAIVVCEWGLGVCKHCGAAEIQLTEWPTCEEYKNRLDEYELEEIERLI